MFDSTPQVVRNLIFINIIFFVGGMVIGEDEAVSLPERIRDRRFSSRGRL
jgi:hypothetical protein